MSDILTLGKDLAAIAMNITIVALTVTATFARTRVRRALARRVLAILRGEDNQSR